VQNFNENLSILIMNGAYAAMSRSGMNINANYHHLRPDRVRVDVLVWRKHGHDQTSDLWRNPTAAGSPLSFCFLADGGDRPHRDTEDQYPPSK